MKVLYITDPGIEGGATRSLVDVVSSMKKRGVECIVCTSSNNALNEELEALGIESFYSKHRAAMDLPAHYKWKRFPKKLIKGFDYYVSIPAVMKRIEKAVDLKTIDIIHTNSARNDIGCLLAKKYHIPHVMHIREFGQEDFGCICYRRNYYKFISRYTTRFIAISQAVKKAWVKKGVEEKKVSVIYNGVDNTKIEPANTEAMRNKTKLKIVIVGGVCEAKGQIQAVEALGILKDNIQLDLDIIGWGDPAYIKKITRRAEELGCKKHVHLLGAKPNIYSLLKDYDIALMCSKSEGFGRVTAEYMHAKLGIIASDTGANPELIENEKNGLLYHYGDCEELANKIIEFYQDRELLIACAENAQARARILYTKERNADLVYNVYTEISEKRMNGDKAFIWMKK